MRGTGNGPGRYTYRQELSGPHGGPVQTGVRDGTLRPLSEEDRKELLKRAYERHTHDL
jgi:hypothetical protein